MTTMFPAGNALDLDFAVDGKSVQREEREFFLKLMGAEYGAKSGYMTEGDLVSVTKDGIDLNALWAEFQMTLQLYNQRRATLLGMLTYPVTDLIETVPQVGETEFEMASEFGVPKATSVSLDYFQMGYDFHDYDVATRYTWKFLRDADARQIEAIHSSIMEADGRLVFRKVMEAIFDNRTRSADIRNQNYNVYPLYNGDGNTPPPFKGQTFRSDHNHYLASGAAQIDSGDLEDMYDHIAEHGYSRENGTVFVAMMNRAQIKEVRKFRQGEVNNNGISANYDFIPASGSPAMIVPNEDGLLGSQVPNTLLGMPVAGSYADIILIEESLIPEGYVFMFGSGGEGNLSNLVGLREHANPAYQGLRLLPGNQQAYPLIDSYYSRGFGTGVRQRAGAVVMQLTTESKYKVPEAYKNGGGLR